MMRRNRMTIIIEKYNILILWIDNLFSTLLQFPTSNRVVDLCEQLFLYLAQ